MEKAATDIYSFRVLRENGFTYVDKTAMILPLCDMSIGKQFFLSGLAPIYAGLEQTTATNYQFAAQEALLEGDVDRLVKVLKSFLRTSPTVSPTGRTNRCGRRSQRGLSPQWLRATGAGATGVSPVAGCGRQRTADKC